MKATIILLCLVAACFAGLPINLSKKWYIGGTFDKAGNISANNIVQWSSAGFAALAKGFNGPVHYVVTDLYGTLYAAGAFSKSGDVVTGPVARYVDGVWQALASNIVWGNNSIAYTLTYDCGRFDSISSIKNPTCDVFVGGNFTATVDGTAQTNVAYFDGSKFVAMATTGAPTATVTRLYKKYGVGASNSKYYLWVGTTVGLYKYDTSTKAWNSPSDLGWKASGKINWIHYKRNVMIWSTDEIYICGEFSIPCETSSSDSTAKTCTNVVKYDYSKAKFYVVGNSVLPGRISVCQLGDNDYLYVNGEFSSGSIKNIAKIKTTTLATAPWDYAPSEVSKVMNGTIHELDICSSLDFGCTSGSYVIVGANKQALYYNNEDGTVTQISGLSGDAKTVASTFSSASSVKMSLMTLAFALVMFLFM